MRLLLKISSIILLALWGIGSASALFAQNGYPAYQEKHINDYADIISDADENRIRSQFLNLEERTAIEATVLTIRSIDEYDTGDATIESFATGLFNTWGIGSATRNEGMLILVALEDREMRIELSDGFGGEHDAAMKRIIENEMLPLFREQQFSQGVKNGSLAAVERIAGSRLQVSGESDSAVTRNEPSSAGRSALTSNNDNRSNTLTSNSTRSTPALSMPSILGSPVDWIASALAALGLGGLGFVGYRKRRRDRPRQCPNCDHLMARLDEASDDLFLDSGQQMEEFLRSVDYDVWQCQNCQAHSVYPYEKWMSNHSQCPGCRYQALETSSHVTDRPTTYSTGRKEVHAQCHHCDYDRTETVVLPRVEVRDDDDGGSSWSSGSSSSSSFSGGSSSGGGASGSW